MGGPPDYSKACRHGNKPAAKCKQCTRDAESLAHAARLQGWGSAGPPDAAELGGGALGVSPNSEGQPGQGHPGRAPESDLPLASVSADPDTSPATHGTSPRAHDASAAGGAAPPPSPPHGGGVAAGGRRVPTRPLPRVAQGPQTVAGKLELTKQLLEAGLLKEGESVVFDPGADALDADGVEEEGVEPPGDGEGRVDIRPTDWARALTNEVRLSPAYRMAVYREGEDYFLVEMVREGEGLWRERVVLGPEGYDVVMARHLDLAVENMSP